MISFYNEKSKAIDKCSDKFTDLIRSSISQEPLDIKKIGMAV